MESYLSTRKHPVPSLTSPLGRAKLENGQRKRQRWCLLQSSTHREQQALTWPQSLGPDHLGPFISSNQDTFVKAADPYDGSQDPSRPFPMSGGAWLCPGSETQPCSSLLCQ